MEVNGFFFICVLNVVKGFDKLCIIECKVILKI